MLLRINGKTAVKKDDILFALDLETAKAPFSGDDSLKGCKTAVVTGSGNETAVHGCKAAVRAIAGRVNNDK